MAFIANLLGFGGGGESDKWSSTGVFYQLNECGGWTCVLPMCTILAQQQELEGFTLMVGDADGEFSDDMRLRANQIRLIREADGPLNGGVQFSVVGGGTFFFEVGDGRDPKEDPVCMAMMQLKEGQDAAEASHAAELQTISSFSPIASSDAIEPSVSVQGELYLWKNGAHTLLLPEATMTLAAGERTMLSLISPGFFWGQELTESMQMTYSHAHKHFVWICQTPTVLVSWRFRVTDGGETEFHHRFCEMLYEAKTAEKFNKQIKEADREWVYESYCNDPIDYSESDEDVEQYEMVLEDEQENDENTATAFSSSGTNQCLAVSTMEMNDRSFVARGNEIGVFKTNDDGVKYAATISAKLNGAEVRPGQIMMHEQDQRMILVDPDQLSTLYCMDVETETIVDEWKTDENCFKVRSILPEEKYAQQQPKKTFVAVNKNAAFLIDPRLRDQKHSSEYGFQMGGDPRLTCAATTGTGQFVTGSETGTIRLMDQRTFREENKADKRRRRAKTALPGYGDPIKGLDVTEDGKWVLATCEKYLLLISTEGDNGTTGFEKSLGKNKRAPIKLQLKPSDIANVGKVSFTPAKFNTRHISNAGGHVERTIVTSTGNYVITWNFRHIKKGRLQEYQMRSYDENIIMDQFVTGQDRAVVVALPSDVTLAKRKVVKEYDDKD